MINSNFRRILFAGASVAALSGCGANDIASPGTGGNITINNNTTAPAPTPTPTPTVTLVQPASGCPTIADAQGLTDGGTITGPTGTWRVCTLPARIVRSITLNKLPGVLYQINGRVDVGFDNGPTALSTSNTRAFTNVPSSTPGATCTGGTCNVTFTADSGIAAAGGNPAGVNLTIQPGVVLFANSGVSWMNVNRGNRITAVGNATTPIVFTSRDNVLGLNTDTSSGQWGGVVLSGRAQITDCAVTNAVPGTNACERQTEGAVDPALYGGELNTDNSGTFSYVQIRYSGYVLSANSELQSLTTQGVGEGTKIDHVQSFNSSDDAAEFFGGHVGVKYFIAVGAEDDNLDTDTGVKGNFQYVLVVQRTGSAAAGADAIIEADSDNALDGNTPRQNVIVSNATFLDRAPNASNDVASILLRGGTDYTIVNSILVSPINPCLRISRAQTASTTQNTAIDEFGAPRFRAFVMQCPADVGGVSQAFLGANGVTAADVSTIFGAGTNANSATYVPTLTAAVSGNTAAFINGATETGVAAFDQTTLNGFVFNGITVTPAGFFEKTAYIGAVSGSSDTWYRGWTCNSTTADFGTGNSGLCTTIPTT